MLAVSLALALTAVACGSSDETTGGSGATDDNASAPVDSAGLIATTASGGQIDFGALEGQDFVLWFWAPW